MFAAKATGSGVAPVVSFADPSYDALDLQSGLAVDASGKSEVANENGQNVTIYANGASGSSVSAIQVDSDLSKLGSTFQTIPSVGSDGKLYLASCTSNSVAIYAVGSATATAAVVGPKTLLQCPKSVTVDAQGDVDVLQEGNASTVNVFAPGATGNVAPIRTFTAPGNDTIIVSGPGTAANPTAVVRAPQDTLLAGAIARHKPVRSKREFATCSAHLPERAMLGSGVSQPAHPDPLPGRNCGWAP